MTKILKAKDVNIKEVLASLRKGGVVVCPTDTVYGLIADATDRKAVEKIFKIKKRNKNKPLPVFVSDIRMAKKLARMDVRQEKFAKSVWPGRTTLVFERKNSGKKLYGLDKRTIALRVPKYKLISSLNNHPLAETSVNVSGQPPLVKIKEIINLFQGKKLQPDLIIDGGDLKAGHPSKVIDLRVFPPKTLRT